MQGGGLDLSGYMAQKDEAELKAKLQDFARKVQMANNLYMASLSETLTTETSPDDMKILAALSFEAVDIFDDELLSQQKISFGQE